MGHPSLEGQYSHSSSLVDNVRFSQQAPIILGAKATSAKINLLPAQQEDPSHYVLLEQLFLSCLQTGDDKSALHCLELLSDRFGPSNERTSGLYGIYEEAVAKGQIGLEKCLQKYDSILSENPVNLPILKRRVAILRSMSKPVEAISSLVEILKAVPTDAEAWCELADLYVAQGMTHQAIFCLEESLLIAANAWNIHARLGEVLYICARSGDETSGQYLVRSIRCFCRSIELCDDYLRGFYGLVMATSPLLDGKQGDTKFKISAAQWEKTIPAATISKLHIFAKRRLEHIIELRSSDHQLWESCQGEIIAAKELLDCLQDTT
ncbi:uncharacterized protein BDW47DRAFT_108350 [Aspergillus candidus]|uniref:ER membrane protein complex subunit 2 n=1 Tax=Aspergillus candidus TaxID=41067 RepID=A0A2I2F7W7_ASPCN|nr:hypothetical protein BDW47DRAFT_108350 [Aspergillus candidus]PLB36713.1 hypothetical protein BDW47DRAFT_108350 [Aspergillus candidus]